MDLNTLSADKVDILSRILPHEDERKLYAERGDDEGLSDEVSCVQWDSVLSDMKELESGFEMARKERAMKGENCPPPLAKFLDTHDERMKQLQEHAKLAQTMPPNEFFSKLSKFVANFYRCKQENDSREAAEKRQRDEAERRSRA
ncbi:unnamed protein product, partial [Cylicostephanus goldi]